MSTQTSRQAPRGLLRLEVIPDTAEIYINETYQGEVSRWLQNTVPVRPGLVRLELRAKGYITQRFDLEVAAYEEVTLSLKLEPSLDAIEFESGAASHGR